MKIFLKVVLSEDYIPAFNFLVPENLQVAKKSMIQNHCFSKKNVIDPKPSQIVSYQNHTKTKFCTGHVSL